jgi:hypothetical protein
MAPGTTDDEAWAVAGDLAIGNQTHAPAVLSPTGSGRQVRCSTAVMAKCPRLIQLKYTRFACNCDQLLFSSGLQFITRTVIDRFSTTYNALAPISSTGFDAGLYS